MRTDPPPAVPASPVTPPGVRAGLRPLLAAGFVTAFGAHAIAATLGRYAAGRHASLVDLGVLLALYDGAEVLLKPVFGALADRVGARPVLLGGLLAFASASAAFVAAGEPDTLAVTRLAKAPPRPPSPQPLAPWSPGSAPTANRAAGSAATAPGKGSATPSAPYSAAP